MTRRPGPAGPSGRGRGAPPEVPRLPGTYVLVLRLSRPRTVEIGGLGVLRFEAGYGLYAGSAFGPGGLAARIGRHLRGAARARWHVDHLRRVADPAEVWFTTDPRRLEHEFARALGGIRGLRPGPRGFGSSDCRCPTHLFLASRRPSPRPLRRRFPDADLARRVVTMKSGALPPPGE